MLAARTPPHTIEQTQTCVSKESQQIQSFKCIVACMFRQRIHSAALHIDLFHQIVSHKMWFCALVNKYFPYFMLAYPSSLPSISIDLCMIYTLYDSLQQPCAVTQSMWVRNSNRGIIYDCIYVVLPVHFSPPFSLSLSNFLQDLENVLASFHAALLNQRSLTPLSLLHHRLL